MVRSVFGLVVLLAVVGVGCAVPPSQRPNIIQADADFPKDPGPASQTVADVDACCSLCWDTTDCVAGVYSQGRCYMKTQTTTLVPTSGVQTCFPQRSGTATSPWPPSPAQFASALGSMHQGGCYYQNKSIPFMLDGALAVHSMGSRMLKLAIAPQSMPHSYAWNSPDWPSDPFPDLVSVLHHPYVATVLSMDFDTFIFTAYSSVGTNRPGNNNYWNRGNISDADAAEETRQFEQAASYVAKLYPHKTFIFSHWEGDWSARGPNNASTPVSAESAAGMIKWLGARQAGVSAARAATGSTRVFHCSEVNLVKSSLLGAPANQNIITAVLPHVAVDFISYSSYDSFKTGLFRQALEFIASHHNRTDASPDVAVFIGEFGVMEEKVDVTTTIADLENCVWQAMAFGAPYLAFWEVYGNELMVNGVRERCKTPTFNPADLAGFWLYEPVPPSSVKPAWPFTWMKSLIDGTHTALQHHHRGTTAAAIAGL